jgi:hypothetical protein
MNAILTLASLDSQIFTLSDLVGTLFGASDDIHVCEILDSIAILESVRSALYPAEPATIQPAGFYRVEGMLRDLVGAQ